ncbi:hypothetical protein GCM10011611_47640 [Aliidongia dinghuensis]|uniref:DUF2252 domain-containing protein n=1 Tax=Aliidongia dinghuensis TaxID=1867774 RepID=A0A8J2YXD7_9PROT|nr:DUF2252 family protein [Aliidongia dinghuensis]GGF35763.1 hypothetical protein GCM10011611_47640 [Aliidongia dinghuensis]
MMDVIEATEAYEHWAFAQIPKVRSDLARKHEAMASGPFPFLRATYYRWAQLWPRLCEDLNDAPRVLSVGDLHVENFGTWRDIEGRLVWGVNDFDEAHMAPYTLDLVRLTASALLALESNQADIARDRIADTILAGYMKHLDGEARPFVLEEPNRWLRRLAFGEFRDPEPFWAKLNGLPDVDGTIPHKVKKHLEKRFPQTGLALRFVHRTAGLGSLGRPRYVALGPWHGSTVAREAKALLPSAWVWARDKGRKRIRYNDLLARAIRCPDPYAGAVDEWLIRRLAPESIGIDLAALPKKKLEDRLLTAMGSETANIHLGTAGAADAIRKDLNGRRRSWLERAADTMADKLREDQAVWRASRHQD